MDALARTFEELDKLCLVLGGEGGGGVKPAGIEECAHMHTNTHNTTNSSFPLWPHLTV